MSGRYRWLVRWLVAEYEAALPPGTRGDCVDGPRPCPHRLCKWHLGHQSRHTCTLDLADAGPQTYAKIGKALGFTAEWARQIEAGALVQLRDRTAHRALHMRDDALRAAQLDLEILEELEGGSHVKLTNSHLGTSGAGCKRQVPHRPGP